MTKMTKTMKAVIKAVEAEVGDAPYCLVSHSEGYYLVTETSPDIWDLCCKNEQLSAESTRLDQEFADICDKFEDHRRVLNYRADSLRRLVNREYIKTNKLVKTNKLIKRVPSVQEVEQFVNRKEYEYAYSIEELSMKIDECKKDKKKINAKYYEKLENLEIEKDIVISDYRNILKWIKK